MICSVAPIRWLSDGPSTPTPSSSLPTSATALQRASLEGTAGLLIDALGLVLAKYPPDDPRTGEPRGLGDAHGLGVPNGERRGSGNRSAPSLSAPAGGEVVHRPDQARVRCPRRRSALTGPTLTQAAPGSGLVS